MADSSDLSITFLRDGAQPASQVAGALTSFLNDARVTLDIAVYDCGLTVDLASEIAAAINNAAGRGVRVRFAYYSGPHRSPVVPPPTGTSEAFTALLHVLTRPITGFQALMHDKYVVRDAGSPGAAVWTGSMNWTRDSWEREENVILQIPSPELAEHYHQDFEELWSSGHVDNTGAHAGGAAAVQYGGAAVPAEVWFSPGQGEGMAHAVADDIRRATGRVIIASPVLTDGPILSALQDALNAGQIVLQGIVDGTQVEEVRQQWRQDSATSWKLAAFDAIALAGHFAGKRSQPYAPGSVHDYMHAKLIVIDDLVYTGSYNFSRSGEENAENLLRFESGPLADACAAFIGELIAAYPPLPPDDQSQPPG